MPEEKQKVGITLLLLLSDCKFFPVFSRRTACDFSELPVKVGDIMETAVKGNFQNILFGTDKRLAGLVYSEMGDILNCAESDVFLKLIHKIAFA